MIAPSSLGFLLFLCLLAHAFFVGAEVALSACDRNRLRGRVTAGDQAALRAQQMLDDPQITRATTMVGANLAMLFAVLLVGLELVSSGANPLWAPLIVAPLLLVLGHLVPKAVAQTHADAMVD
ncbi:MAG TPA: DUF21 domain-containing protein, partial [Kofleriaceae bacterium]